MNSCKVQASAGKGLVVMQIKNATAKSSDYRDTVNAEGSSEVKSSDSKEMQSAFSTDAVEQEKGAKALYTTKYQKPSNRYAPGPKDAGNVEPPADPYQETAGSVKKFYALATSGDKTLAENASHFTKALDDKTWNSIDDPEAVFRGILEG
jgi:hypothetical protein